MALTVLWCHSCTVPQACSLAPHSMDVFWGKHFGWYMIDNQPLLVFPLDDCTDMAWYGPEK